MSTTFIGEHLRPGHLGHFFIICSFVTSLFSAFCFLRAAQTEQSDAAGSQSWLLLARNSFVVHTAAIFGIFLALYYIITHHLFEYNYAWQHSSRALPGKYLLSCFWEGQEGSFMLWMFWHSMLGIVVMRTAGSLETRVMTIVSVVQVCLASMLLGFYFSPHFKVGSTPFLMLREAMQGAPIFADPNYLGNFIHDGNGLNVLLQNYWMVIHPPILFLGFASTLIPFSFIIAALWKGDYKTFVKQAVNWSLFSGGILILGIMMGGRWAYESLTFGGYWAWDPVENASLVPWLTLVAGLHTLIVYKATGRSFIITMVLYMLTYLLVWYSTFLTRTGVLGDTSVHAFTGEGKSLYWHLLVVLGFLILLSIAALAKRWKELPRIKTEEAASSREFWMFIGSFLFLISAAHIVIVTSVPVWAPIGKWITGKNPAPPVDPVQHYNTVQVGFAIAIGILSASVLFLKFKMSDMKGIWRTLGIIAAVSLVLALLIGFGEKITAWQYCLLLFAGCFGLVANIYYAFFVQGGSLKKRGAALTHFGFAVMIVGILISSYKKHVISFNILGEVMNFGKKTEAENVKESQENVILYKNTPVAMGEYFATYTGDSSAVNSADPRAYYNVRFERRDSASQKVLEAFTLHPDAFINPKGQQGLSSNPDYRSYLTYDVFTYVNAISPREKVDTGAYQAHTVKAGDSIFCNNGYLIFNGFDRDVHDPRYQSQPGDVAVAARLTAYNLGGAVRELRPIFFIRGNSVMQVDDTLRDFGLFTRFASIIPQQDAAVIETKQADPKDDYIVLKAIIFPYIKVLWLGVILMVSGFVLSLVNRVTKREKVVMDVMGS